MDEETDAAALIAEARAYLEWERELGGIGVRRLPRRVVQSVAPAVQELPRVAPVAPEALHVQAAPEAPRVQAAPEAPSATTRLPLEETQARLKVLADEAAACTACRLHQGRTKSVFARGNVAAELAFVGEGPGYNEDQRGLPFVGEAGQLLDRMIAAMGYKPDAVYICNVVKCRPPENRTPLPDEASACSPFLAGQLALVRPKVLVALGRCATEGLGVMPPSGRGWRGQWGQWNGIPVMPTYHPAYLLRSPEQKGTVWKDLQNVMARLGSREGRP